MPFYYCRWLVWSIIILAIADNVIHARKICGETSLKAGDGCPETLAEVDTSGFHQSFTGDGKTFFYNTYGYRSVGMYQVIGHTNSSIVNYCSGFMLTVSR